MSCTHAHPFICWFVSHLPSFHACALRAVAFQPAVGAWGARHTAIFQLAVRTGVALRAVAFQLAVRTRVTLRAHAFPLTVRASLHSHSSRTTKPRATSLCARGSSWVVVVAFLPHFFVSSRTFFRVTRQNRVQRCHSRTEPSTSPRSCRHDRVGIPGLSNPPNRFQHPTGSSPPRPRWWPCSRRRFSRHLRASSADAQRWPSRVLREALTPPSASVVRTTEFPWWCALLQKILHQHNPLLPHQPPALSPPPAKPSRASVSCWARCCSRAAWAEAPR